mmetsp:Transcript_20082/g.43755  ORF Transcript_20082/g.43755 Transcript_20082/m.43755 type:complete len:82 (+) Transcript_20082:512-757(+)
MQHLQLVFTTTTTHAWLGSSHHNVQLLAMLTCAANTREHKTAHMNTRQHMCTQDSTCEHTTHNVQFSKHARGKFSQVDVAK